MNIGFLARFDEERIHFARNNGFGCVELLVGPDADFCPPNAGWKYRAAEVQAAYAAANLTLSCIGGFYVNHMDADAGVADRHHQHVRNIILLAETMEIPVVAGFSGRLLNQPLEASLPRFRELWSEHARFAQDHGVKIAFENCPMGEFHSPFGGINCICTVAMWERCFNEVPSDAIGLEWDASHLICQLVDPVLNLRTWGRKVFHVHAKDAKLSRDVVDRYGLYHPGAVEHCFPAFGDTDWAGVIKELLRAGYRGDVNIEGWHDAVYRNTDNPAEPQFEDTGLLIARRHLAQYTT